jgi:FMN phosphatase YigB (HAD superfamily)
MIVSFDFWNTLYKLPGTKESRSRIRSKVLSEACKSLGVVPAADALAVSESLFDNVDGFIKERWRCGECASEDAILDHLRMRWNWITMPTWLTLREALHQIYCADLKPQLWYRAEECLQWCSERCAIYLISDTFTLTGRTLRQIMNIDGILSYFKHTYFSDEVGFKKPNPYAFNDIIDRELCQPSQLVHIGDDLEADYGAAQAANASFILFAPDVPSGRRSGYSCASSYAEITSLLSARRLQDGTMSERE